MTSPEAAAIIAEYDSVILYGYCTTTSSILFLYDCFLTIGEEAEYFWTSRQTGAAMLFYLNRYFNLFWYAYNFAGFGPMSNERCIAIVISSYIFELLPYMIWAAFAALRVFALSNRSHRWIASLLVFALSIVPFIINLVNFAYGLTGETLSVVGCIALIATPSSVSRRLTIASRTCLLAADCIVMGTTWMALSKRADLRRMHRDNTFASVLLTDGTIYFLILLFLNALHLTFTLLSVDVITLQKTSVISFFTGPLSAILVQRFLLHLQSANRKALGMASTQVDGTSHMSSVVFDRVVGSLGASLAPEDYWEGDNEGVPDESPDHALEKKLEPLAVAVDGGDGQPQAPVLGSIAEDTGS